MKWLTVMMFVLTGLLSYTIARGENEGSPAAHAKPPKGVQGKEEKCFEMDEKQASAFARLALKSIVQEYPNKPEHVMNGASDVLSPRALHPAFYGSFDWHSSVHGHWMLVRLLKCFPALPEAAEIRAALGKNLTAENLRVEAEYFAAPNRQSFEF